MSQDNASAAPSPQPFIGPKLPRHREYLIESWMPARQVHLLGGSSGAGKTRWLINMLETVWSKGDPVFGHNSHPVPWAFISGDRDWEDMRRMLESLEEE